MKPWICGGLCAQTLESLLWADTAPTAVARECPHTAQARPGVNYIPNSPFSAEIPIDGPAQRHHTADLVAESLLKRWPPGHELKPHPIIDHGEPARSERDALAIDAGNVLALGGRAMGKSGVGSHLTVGLDRIVRCTDI